MVYGIEFHLIGNLQRIFQCFGYIGKDAVHLCRRFHPFLFGITHTVWIIQVLSCTKTDKAVVCLGIFLVGKMDIVGGYQLYTVLTRKFDKYFVYSLLLWEGCLICIGTMCFVPLHLQIKIVAKQVFEPANSLFGLTHPIFHNMLGDFSSKTCRTHDESFVIFFKQIFIDTGPSVESFGPRKRNHFY